MENDGQFSADKLRAIAHSQKAGATTFGVLVVVMKHGAEFAARHVADTASAVIWINTGNLTTADVCSALKIVFAVLAKGLRSATHSDFDVFAELRRELFDAARHDFGCTESTAMISGPIGTADRATVDNFTVIPQAQKLDWFGYDETEQSVDVAQNRAAGMLTRTLNDVQKRGRSIRFVGVQALWEASEQASGSGSELQRVIRQACLETCRDPAAKAKAVLRCRLEAPNWADADCFSDPRDRLPEWANRLSDASVDPCEDAILIWLDLHDRDGNPVGVSTDDIDAMLGATAQRTGTQWVFVVALTPTAAIDPDCDIALHTIDDPPVGVAAGDACGDVVRVTGLSSAWLNMLSGPDVKRIAARAFAAASPALLEDGARRDVLDGSWIQRVFRDTDSSIMLRVRVTDVVVMHILRGCIFEKGLNGEMQRGFGRWAAAAGQSSAGTVNAIAIDKRCFAEHYMLILQQLDKLTVHQQDKLAEIEQGTFSKIHVKGPAGSGKTFLGLHVVKGLLDRKPPVAPRILFVAPNPAMCQFFGQWLCRRYAKDDKELVAVLGRDACQIDVLHFGKGGESSTDVPDGKDHWVRPHLAAAAPRMIELLLVNAPNGSPISGFKSICRICSIDPNVWVSDR